MEKLVMGVTGGFGSGKSTVVEFFRKNSTAKVLDADKIARRIVRAKEKIIQSTLGITNTKKMADIVFSDTKKLSKLNRIIHPEVRRIIKKDIRKTRKKIIILDIPLLIEAKMLDMVDKVVVVKISKNKQIKRLGKKFDEKEIKRRIRAQMPLRKKLKYADYIVDNNGSKRDTEMQVRKVLEDLL